MNITEEQQEIKKEFQLERVILFSDAVFAIIITIMVIDIKLPEEAHDASIKELQHAFFGIFLKLLAYAISFFIVASFWVRHLKMFSFLRDYNVPLLALNLLFLFSVSLFPFAVSLISGSAKLNSFLFGWGANVYIGIILLAIMAQTMLMAYLVRNKAQLCINNADMESTLMWKAYRPNLIIIPLMAIIVCVFNYMNVQPMYSMYIVALLGITNSRLRKWYYPKAKREYLFLQLFKRSSHKKEIASLSKDTDPTA